MNPFAWLIILALGGSVATSSVKIVRSQNEALVERLGNYNRKLEPGLNFVVPLIDRIAYRETIREKVIDIPPQRCVTKDNVSIEADAVVYWRIVDMEKAYYKVENLQRAMENLVLTQIRAEMGKLELDQTFTARTEVNEILLRELDVATDPWGVKVTRVELRDITPSKTVQDSMELQMSAERKKRAAILTSEGERDSAVNSARGRADSQILQAEANQKALVIEAEAQKQATILKAEAEREQQILKAQATAQAMQIVNEKLQSDPNAREALKFILAQSYLEMGKEIGSSDSSKIMFMDPRNMLATLEGMRSVLGDNNSESLIDIDKTYRSGN